MEWTLETERSLELAPGRPSSRGLLGQRGRSGVPALPIEWTAALEENHGQRETVIDGASITCEALGHNEYLDHSSYSHPRTSQS